MKQKIHEKIVEIIGIMIESGHLLGGDKLPPERKLAETHQVSRNTVREAIKTLVEKKVLISKVGSGTYVAGSALEILRSSIEKALEKKRHHVMDIFELRSILEPQIAALAAKRISADEIDILGKALSNQENALRGNRNTREYDEEFHRILAKATGNKSIFHMYDKLQDIFSESRADELQSLKRQQTSLTIHKDIYEAIKNRDSAKAARQMKKHMRLTQKSLDYLKSTKFIKRSVK